MAAQLAKHTKSFVSAAHHILYHEQHLEFQAVIRKVINQKLNPYVLEWEKGIYPAHHVFKILGNLGVFAVNKPEKFGGLGEDFSMSIAVAEELGSIQCGGVPMSVLVQTDMATPALSQFATDKLCRQFLTPSVSGDVVACIAVSEPHAGSDVSAIRTSARRSGGDLIINGSKMWITNGAQVSFSMTSSIDNRQADWACVLLNTGDSSSVHHNKSLVCVPLNLPGVSRSKPLQKMGMKCSDTAQLHFDDVRVPASYVIGEEGRGFVYQMKQFNDERLVTVAVGLRPLQKCIDDTLRYARERKLFGSTILDQQFIQYRLAELQVELEATRSLLYSAVRARMEGEDVTLMTAMAKLKIGRLARNVTDQCVQVWGGAGYLDDNYIARTMRDLRVFSIGAGCDEVMLSIIHRHMNKSVK